MLVQRTRSGSLFPFGERAGVRGIPLVDNIERPKPLTPPLSLWEREQTELVARVDLPSPKPGYRPPETRSTVPVM
jgi:hypothetical protein